MATEEPTNLETKINQKGKQKRGEREEKINIKRKGNKDDKEMAYLWQEPIFVSFERLSPLSDVDICQAIRLHYHLYVSTKRN